VNPAVNSVFRFLLGDRAVNNWHYRLAPAGDGTDVTESFRLTPAAVARRVLAVGRLSAEAAQHP
jgi:hypothetical protein